MRQVKSRIIIFSGLLASGFIPQAIAKELPKTELNPVIVTASPLSRSASELMQPVTVLAGDDLLKKSQPTLGETLSGELGIRSSYFGPNASRPVIRGLDGDQIQILQNGVSNLDASANSVDHNVSVDPLSIERIEVIRGPAALLYGSKAVGGVVNVIDNRIPDEPIAEKLTVMADAHYNSVNNERAGSMLFEGGVGQYAWHVNRFRRIVDDLKIPGFARSKNLRNQEPLDQNDEAKNTLPNSQGETDGSSVGISRFFKKGYFGLALTNYNSNYGVVAESDVTIGMEQRRLDFAGAFKEPIAHVKEVKFKLGLSDYEHSEFEGSEVGTVFKNRGYDSRIEVVHNKFGVFEGAIGVQSSISDFSANGQEAFLPATTTRTNSGFIFEEIVLEKLSFQLGSRIDHQTIKADKNAVFTSENSRQDTVGSGSAGFIYRPIKGYAVALSSSYTQRAPTAQELFANGVHVATNNFEVGSKDLEIQKSTGFDLSLRKESGSLTGEVNLFYNRFQNFIALMPSGALDGESELPIYNYLNMPAEFYGAEAKANFNAYDFNAQKLAFEARADYVEGRNSKTKEALPRIAPLRLGASAIYRYEKVGLRLDADYTFAQSRVAQFERSSKGYTMLNAGVDYAINLGSVSSILYLKATNLLDQEARSHVSFLKDVAPLPGRSLMIGVRGAF